MLTDTGAGVRSDRFIILPAFRGRYRVRPVHRVTGLISEEACTAGCTAAEILANQHALRRGYGRAMALASGRCRSRRRACRCRGAFQDRAASFTHAQELLVERSDGIIVQSWLLRKVSWICRPMLLLLVNDIKLETARPVVFDRVAAEGRRVARFKLP